MLSSISSLWSEVPFSIIVKFGDKSVLLKVTELSKTIDQELIDRFLSIISSEEVKKKSKLMQTSLAIQFFKQTMAEAVDLSMASQLMLDLNFHKAIQIWNWIKTGEATPDEIEEFSKTWQFKFDNPKLNIMLWNIAIELHLNEFPKELFLEDPESLYCQLDLFLQMSKKSQEDYYFVENILIDNLPLMSHNSTMQYILAQFINDFINLDTHTNERLRGKQIHKYLIPLENHQQNQLTQDEMMYPCLLQRASRSIFVDPAELYDALQMLSKLVGDQEDEDVFIVEEAIEDVIPIGERKLLNEIKDLKEQLEQANNKIASLFAQMNTKEEEIDRYRTERQYLLVTEGLTKSVMGKTNLGQTNRVAPAKVYKESSTQTDQITTQLLPFAEINKKIDNQITQPTQQLQQQITNIAQPQVNQPPPPPPNNKALPPPPPGKGPPPPLPKQQVAIPVIKTNMKPLPWKQIEQEGIWKQIDCSKVKLNTKEIEDLFKFKSQVQPKAVQIQETPTIKKISLLDHKRQNEVTIALSRIKYSISVLVEAIQETNIKILTLDTLEMLQKAIPNEKEVNLWNNCKEPLIYADEFCQQISKIPHFRERITSLVVHYEFPQQANNISSIFTQFTNTFKKIQNDDNLQIALQYILAIGNTINGRGAQAVSLESLINIDYKSDTSKMEFYQYLVKQLELNGHPVIVEDLSDYEYLSREINGMDNLKVFLAQFQKSLPQIKLSAEYNQLFTDLHEAIDEFIMIQEGLISRLETQLNETLQYFGLKCSSDRLFYIIWTFKRRIQDAKAALKEQQRKEALEREREERKKKRSQK